MGRGGPIQCAYPPLLGGSPLDSTHGGPCLLQSRSRGQFSLTLSLLLLVSLSLHISIYTYIYIYVCMYMYVQVARGAAVRGICCVVRCAVLYFLRTLRTRGTGTCGAAGHGLGRKSGSPAPRRCSCNAASSGIRVFQQGSGVP